jgi:hypothetical protein
MVLHKKDANGPCAYDEDAGLLHRASDRIRAQVDTSCNPSATNFTVNECTRFYVKFVSI